MLVSGKIFSASRKIVFAALALCFMLAPAAPALAAGEIVRLGVLPFTSKASNVSAMQAAIITDIFTRTLTNSRSIALIEREQMEAIGREIRLSMSGLVDMNSAIEVGRLAGVQYVLTGAVTGLDEKVGGGGFAPFGIVTGNRTASATIDVRVVDVTTSEIVLSLVQTGTANQQSQAFSWRGIRWAEADLSDIKAGAVEDAATRLGIRIREELAGEYSQVLTAGGRTVNINLGATSGVQAGDLYLVYTEGREMRDFDGTSLGSERHPVAVVRAISVSSGFTVCEGTDGGGSVAFVQRGDKVEPISAQDAKALAQQKRFVRARPQRRAYEETAARLFGEEPQYAEPAEPQYAQAPDPEPSPIEDYYSNRPQPEPVRPAQPVEQERQVAPTAPSSRYEVPEEPAPEPETEPNNRQSEYDALAASRSMRAAPEYERIAPRSGNIAENVSTDPARVVASYPIDPAARYIRRLNHISASERRTARQVYDAYAALAESYEGDYLAAYMAGMTARKMRRGGDANAWFDKALAINPNYQPAVRARARVSQ